MHTHPRPPTKSGTSRTDTAYASLRQRILDNVWPPGYQALEQEIALELRLSRTPVREALIRLEREGLVQVIPRHGMRVLPMSATDMKEIYEILTALECLAVELVANHRPTEAQLAPLVQATQAMADALDRDDLDAWARADESFHSELIALARNRLLGEAIFSHWDRAHRARMFTLRLRPKPVNSTQEHTALVECLRRGDSAGASAVNKAHRQRASRELLAIFERYRLQQV